MKKKLSVGCGNKTFDAETVRLDISAEVNPDVIWDLNQFPYPFEDSSFSKVECSDVIEHLADIPKAMNEFYRLLEAGGMLEITTPHYSCANSFVDPTHKWHLSYFSFDYFCKDHSLSYYSHSNFRIQKKRIHFQGNRLYKSVLLKIANRFPHSYEQNWAWIFPAWFLYFELEAIK